MKNSTKLQFLVAAVITLVVIPLGAYQVIHSGSKEVHGHKNFNRQCAEAKLESLKKHAMLINPQDVQDIMKSCELKEKPVTLDRNVELALFQTLHQNLRAKAAVAVEEDAPANVSLFGTVNSQIKQSRDQMIAREE